MPATLLFVYGLLQPGWRPPRTTVRSFPDKVRGLLYDLGDYPAAVRIGQADDCFSGSVVEIDEEEIPELDVFEEVDLGVYSRKRTVTQSGVEVWIYEYRLQIPEGLSPIRRWPEKTTR